MIRVILMTVPLAEAEEIARKLLEKKLCACVNMVEQVQSFYWWEGKIQKDKEGLLIIKTPEEKVSTFLEEAKKIHPYKVPEILSLEVKEGNLDYLNWVRDVVK